MGQNVRAIQALWGDDQAFASSLLAVLVNKYGTQFFDWEPDTLRAEIRDTWRAKPSESNLNKLWALLTAITTNSFYVSGDVYNHICNGLDGDVSMEMWDPATPEEMAWAVVEVWINDPPDQGSPDYKFSHEVRVLTGAILQQHGFHKAPELLAFAELSQQASPVTDDAELYATFWKNQASLSQTLNDHIRLRFDLLKKQLEGLSSVLGVTFDLEKIRLSLTRDRAAL